MLITTAGNPLSSQTIRPDTAVRIDNEKVEQYNSMINDINKMQLRCELLNFIDNQPTFLIKTICFDEEKRLRKYYLKHEVSDGANEYVNIRAYYNEKGDLFYLYYGSDNNCVHCYESYWINEGKIINFYVSYGCGCCDEDDDEYEKEKKSHSIVIGSPLTKSINKWKLFDYFIHADTLLKALQNGEE